jgi:acyl-coenzyme A thioesterase PaaI-like protein
MDYDGMRAGLAQMIPFNAFLGIELAELSEGRAVAVLPDRDELKNHVGSQHAGALFTVGEWASGAAFVSAFAERMGEITPLAERGDIHYAAIARGPIRATAELEDAAALHRTLDADGRVRFDVKVDLADGEGKTVATMTVGWYVRKNA